MNCLFSNIIVIANTHDDFSSREIILRKQRFTEKGKLFRECSKDVCDYLVGKMFLSNKEMDIFKLRMVVFKIAVIKREYCVCVCVCRHEQRLLPPRVWGEWL